MEDDQKNVLQKHYKIIVDSVQYHNVVPRLVSEGILTTHDAERIKAGETSQDQMIRLMGIILNCNKPNVFEIFVRTLEEDQEDAHTAKTIRQSLQRIRISRRLKKQDRAIDRESRMAERHTVTAENEEHLRNQGLVVPDGGGGGGAVGEVGAGSEEEHFHPALRESRSMPGPDPGASYNKHRARSFTGGRSLDSCSYWVPEMDCDLYFVLVNKSDGNGTCGIKMEKNIHIGGITVTDVATGSMADASHLQKLDVIRTVDGENICAKSVASVQQMFDLAEKRFILGIVRSNQSVVKQNVEILMKKQPGLEFNFKFICGEMWPRYLGDSDCYISEITPAGLADRLGLKVGDTLIRVNGKTLQRLEYGDVMRALLPELNDPQGAVVIVKRAEFE